MSVDGPSFIWTKLGRPSHIDFRHLDRVYVLQQTEQSRRERTKSQLVPNWCRNSNHERANYQRGADSIVDLVPGRSRSKNKARMATTFGSDVVYIVLPLAIIALLPQLSVYHHPSSSLSSHSSERNSEIMGQYWEMHVAARPQH